MKEIFRCVSKKKVKKNLILMCNWKIITCGQKKKGNISNFDV